MRLNKSLTVVGSILVAMVCIVPLGCSGKEFTPEDFKKVEKGASESSVKELLGSPKETLEALGSKRMFWIVGDKYYSISFKDGKVEEPMGPTGKMEYDMMKAVMEGAKNIKL
jgi:hypothetical protein